MKRLTMKEAVQGHREEWDWIVKNKKTKWEWLMSVGKDKDLDNGCFLCEYNLRHKQFYCQDRCLLVWPGGSCMEDESPYIKLPQFYNEDPKAFIRLAKQIRDLPLNPKHFKGE